MKTLLIAVCLTASTLSLAPAAPPETAVPATLARPILRFVSIDGDPGKVETKDLKFQVSALHVRQPTSFLAIGDVVPGTKFKLTKFELKFRGEEDLSELTLVNTETKENLVLVLGVPSK